MEPGKSYHIYNRANGNENLFRSDENFRYFMHRYAHFIIDVADTYAYCLMPNHIHFLIKVKSVTELEASFRYYSETSRVSKNLGDLSLEKRISQQFSNLFNSYTKAFNKMYSRSGSLFTPNFKRKEISNSEYFKNVILYIHQKPIHHGFANNLTDWPWTSFQAMLVDLPTQLKRNEVLGLFGNSSEYLHFHSLPIPKEVLSEISA